jgi:hypothetical protein
VAVATRLGEGRRHKLNEVIVDLDVFANTLEGEELGKSSSRSYGKNEGAHAKTKFQRKKTQKLSHVENA